MDAKDVRPAWEGLQRGEISDDPRVRATQERLQACSYAMSHPESDTLVPACVQHSVLDSRENIKLMELLPLEQPVAADGAGLGGRDREAVGATADRAPPGADRP